MRNIIMDFDSCIMEKLLKKTFQQDLVIHISLKLANIAQLKGELEKSMLGFNWTMQKIEERAVVDPNDVELKELYGLAKYWFGQLLMKNNSYEAARAHLKSAYEFFIEIHGLESAESITILNDLSVACEKLERLDESKGYILTAIKLAKKAGDSQQEGILLANLGLIQLKQGLLDEAKRQCSEAWRLGKKLKDNSTIKQAEYCLDQLKTK
ncbi:tetratricopeptide repeat domain 19 [Musca autumnalis]|uniref:tetratricopeptide repeat domain 19 n=1 Tax=Musca autumnalis TaxID=221902 RepID=UPI003CECB90F